MKPLKLNEKGHRRDTGLYRSLIKEALEIKRPKKYLEKNLQLQLFMAEMMWYKYEIVVTTWGMKIDQS